MQQKEKKTWSFHKMQPVSCLPFDNGCFKKWHQNMDWNNIFFSDFQWKWIFLCEILILNYCTFQTNVTLAEKARQHRSRQLQQQFMCQLPVYWIVLKFFLCVCVFLLQCSNMNCTNFVRKFYSLPSWYIINTEVAKRLNDIAAETNYDLQTALFYITLDCSTCCEGCIFCQPEMFQKIVTWEHYQSPRNAKIVLVLLHQLTVYISAWMFSFSHILNCL